MYPVLFKIGEFTVYTYGAMVFLGVLLGYFVALRQARREGIANKDFSDIFFWTVIFAFSGARFLFLIVEFDRFLQNPLGMLLSRSGFVFYGAIIAGIAAVYLLTSKRKSDRLKVFDSFALAIPLGHVFGRIGCFCYGCCYGRPTDSPFGILFPPGCPAGSLGVKVIPTQLISALALFLIFVVLKIIASRKKFDGQLTVFYFIIYGLFRFIIEIYRGDPRGTIMYLSTSQVISVIMVLIGGILLFKLTRKT